MRPIFFFGFLLLGALPPLVAHAQQALPWHRFPPLVSSALQAFRQTDHWLADAMAKNLDGNRLGQDTAEGPPMNFDPTSQLRFALHDLNGDGRPEVFLLFDSFNLFGNAMPGGVLMIPQGRNGWRIGCDIYDFGAEDRRYALHLIATRSHGWRHFRTSDGEYGWHLVAGQAECLPRGPSPQPPRWRRR